MKRRNAVLALTAAAAQLATPVARAQSQLTPSQVEGPFYPVEPIPLRNQLLEAGGRGEPLRLSGRVLDPRGQALSNIRVEIWQADANGRYRHPRDGDVTQVDPKFAAFGAVVTDAQGQYTFDTIVPVPYGGRPPHIHVRLKRGATELLTTQLYLRGQTKEGGMMGIFGGVAERERLSLNLATPEAGRRTARFDFVVNDAR